MPTYLFDRTEPVEAIIEADGKFGPDQMYQATAIYEMLNVFGGVEWALYMKGNFKQTSDAMDKNPFVAEFDSVWTKEPVTGHVEIGSVAKISISRQVAHTVLKAKFGANAQTQLYISEAEYQDGFRYWLDFVDDEGFNRMALIDDFEAWSSALEVNPGS